MIQVSVEEAINELLEAKAEKLTQTTWYECDQRRQSYRSESYNRNLTATSGNITLKPKVISFLTATLIDISAGKTA